MSSYIVGALPFVTLLFMLVREPRLPHAAVHDRRRPLVLGYGVVSWSLGFLWMKQA